MVDVYKNGVRTRTCYATEEDARQTAMRKAGNLVSEGLQAMVLSRDQRLDAERAIQILDGTATLEAAADFFMKHAVSGEAGKAVRNVVTDLLHRKRGANRRPGKITNAAYHLNRFVKTFGDRPLGTITRHDPERWPAGLECNPITRDNLRRAVVGLFNYGQRRGLCDRNPALGLARSGRDESMPVIFSVKQAEDLLTAAQTHAPETIPILPLDCWPG